MKIIKEKLNQLFKLIIKYIYTNRLFLSYSILALFGAVMLRGLTIGNYFAFYPFCIDLGIVLLIGSFAYLIKPQNQFKYFLTCLFILLFMKVLLH